MRLHDSTYQYGFPVIRDLNEVRADLFEESFSSIPKNPTIGRESDIKIKNLAKCIGHHLLTPLCLSLNFVAVAISLTGMAVTACTLGAFKVAVFAFTIGNVKPKFSIGFNYLAERVYHSLYHIFKNIGNITYDVPYLFYKTKNAIRFIGRTLKIDFIIAKIFNKIKAALEVIVERIEQGGKAALNDEKFGTDTTATPAVLKFLSEAAKPYRIDVKTDKRSISHIAKHYALSIPSLAVNSAALLVYGSASLAAISLFALKIIFFIPTQINIPVRTYVPQLIDSSATLMGNIFKEVTCDVADAFILIYKLGRALYLDKAIATIKDVVMYIPQAVFS